MDQFSLLWSHFIRFFDTPIGIVGFIALYAIWVTMLLPGLWPSMLGGLIYGQVLGTIAVFLGAFIGAEITFFLGRKIFRSWTEKRIANFPKFQAIEKAVSKEGFKLVFLTRLSPLFPFSLLNFMYGLTDVTIRDFTLGLLGILPGTILFCGLGSVAGDIGQFNGVLSADKDISSNLFRILGLLATCAVVFFVSRAANNALQEFDSPK
tara:strand:+ start:241 stop:861 length:621 start_codon:yes stop_codon:yes gene_type:complete